MKKCKEHISDKTYLHYYRCSRNAWKDGYCKQHHPETVKKRREESQRKWEAKHARSPLALLAKANARIKELEEELIKLRMR